MTAIPHEFVDLIRSDFATLEAVLLHCKVVSKRLAAAFGTFWAAFPLRRSDMTPMNLGRTLRHDLYGCLMLSSSQQWFETAVYCA